MTPGADKPLQGVCEECIPLFAFERQPFPAGRSQTLQRVMGLMWGVFVRASSALVFFNILKYLSCLPMTLVSTWTHETVSQFYHKLKTELHTGEDTTCPSVVLLHSTVLIKTQVLAPFCVVNTAACSPSATYRTTDNCCCRQY